MSRVYDRVALIGLGLIASSIFWAIRRGDLAGEVTGYARSGATRDTARRIGLCDRVCDSAAEAVAVIVTAAAARVKATPKSPKRRSSNKFRHSWKSRPSTA